MKYSQIKDKIISDILKKDSGNFASQSHCINLKQIFIWCIYGKK